jgi:hypothetical protein
MKPQSGSEYSLGPNKHKEQNVVFTDQISAFKTEVVSVMDPTRSQQDTHDADLADFFARPIKIKEFEWSIGSDVFEQFNPWSEYLENPRVSNRIANFNMLRCKLHLKFVINANGFMYSRVLVSYLPFHQWDALTESSSLIPQDAVQESQMPHIFLNPTTSTGGEMILPFVWPENNVHIPTSDWDKLGRITMRSLALLKHANGATGVATISVFAWAEEMSLNVLTSVDPDTMTAQMGLESEVDEANQKGVISGPATAVANVSKALSVVPEIAPFAMATAHAASTVAGVAKAFGYSRPTQTRDNCPVKPVATSSLSLTTVPDTVQKLTLDDKQELTIDPRIAGLGGEDTMSIKKIATTESYLTSFSWPIGTAPGTLLWNGRVDPCTFAYDGVRKYHFPACCVAALPFKYWTGTMKFRFQIMSSAYHKGRLKVSYDPNWVGSEEFNTMYTRVVDLASETDFTISVSNGQTRTLVDHHMPAVDSVSQLYSTTRYLSKEQGNGVVAVSVLNELTTPNSTVNNDISVNVFVSAGDDFEVFVPTHDFSYFVYKPQMGLETDLEMTPQSGPEITPDSFASEQDKPEHETGESIGPTVDSLEHVSAVFTGESVKSFRQVLKRYNLHTAIAPIIYGERNIDLKTCYFPYLRGKVADAVGVTQAGNPYNYCNTMLLHWIVNCFSSWRGSIRTKIIPGGRRSWLRIFAERDLVNDLSTLQYILTNTAYNTYTTNSEAGQDCITTLIGEPKTFGANGQMFTISEVNPVAELEVPYYSSLRFVPGKIENHTGPRMSDFHEMSNVHYKFQVLGDEQSFFDIHYAIGEDFSTYFWTGCPPMYYEDHPPLT